MTDRSHTPGPESSHHAWGISPALPRLAVVLMCALLPTSVRAAVTFLSAEVDAIAFADIRAGNRASNQKVSDFVLTPETLSADANAIVHNGPSDYSSIHATSTGSFTDSTSGTIAISGSGAMKTDTRYDSPFSFNEWSITYSYDFIIDQVEPFFFDYKVFGNATPLDPAVGFVLFQPYEFKLTNVASGLVATGSFSSGDTGRIAIPLGFDASVPQSGAYHLEVTNFTRGVLNAQGSGTFDATGDFAFKIGSLDVPAAGVPEPATWAMMILGLGGVGATVRRRRATPPFANA